MKERKEADMHIHSNHSGGCSVFDLMSLIWHWKREGLKAAVLTDYDTIGELEHFMDECGKCNIDTMTGVEISSYDLAENASIYILGYGFDLEKFKSKSPEILGKNINIRSGTHYPHGEDHYVCTSHAIKLLKDCGGVAVWAHPTKDIEKLKEKHGNAWVEAFAHLLNRMMIFGLDGVEINTPHSSNVETSDMVNLFKKHSKWEIEIFTGGSDYQGHDRHNGGNEIGEFGLSYDQFISIKNRRKNSL